MKRFLWTAFQTLIFVLCPISAFADGILTICGESKGDAYYFEGGLVGPGQGGWHQDGISGGSFTLLITDNKLDIIFKDATGNTYSHLKEGDTVRLISANKDVNTFLVISENAARDTVEHYLFALNQYGVGTVAWGTIRSNDTIKKSSLMTARCSQEAPK